MPQPEGHYKYRKHVSARDLGERLFLDFDINEILLWPPNMFAYTSYILSLTGAYQLVISPPRGKTWPPTVEDISGWFNQLAEKVDDWIDDLAAHWRNDKAPWNLEEILNDIEQREALLKRIKGYDFEAEMGRHLPAAPPEAAWGDFVRRIGDEWRGNLSVVERSTLDLIKGEELRSDDEAERAKTLLRVMLSVTPVPVIACWLVFYPLLNVQSSISTLLCNNDNCEPADLDRYWPAAQAIISLHAIVDEACIGWGIHQQSDTNERKMFGGTALRFAEEMLLEDGTMATISNERCRVLPKRHNPNVGITLRSLSSNLAFHRSSIEVVWRQAERNPLSSKLDQEMKLKACAEQPSTSSSTISVLLLPWPMQIHTNDFKNYETKKPTLPIALNRERYGFFVYSPDKERKDDFSNDDVIDMIEAAEREGDAVGVLIMPEASIGSEKFSDLETKLTSRAKNRNGQPVSVLIAGVREEPEEATFARNAVYCKTIRKEGGNNFTYKENGGGKHRGVDRTAQFKHHRWKLDESQIRQYGLSTVLNPRQEWWEAIKVGKRRVSFINLGNKITICPLICEDLARQDPIADLIRHVGPTLVITILMDGPQKADRWSSRYAGVLSEDPGSAVITLSSYGMVRRWNSPYRQMSSVVALWNDGRGPAREIELAQGAEGILMRLRVSSECEPIADGRIEKYPTAKINLLDVIQVYRTANR